MPWSDSPLRRACVAAAIAVTLVACGSDDGPSGTAEGYCALIEANAAALDAPAIATQFDIDATLALYDAVVEAAPLAVRAEWETLGAALRTAAAVNPGDTASVQAAADAARAAEPAARLVADYTADTCGITLSIAPLPTTSAPTTEP
jgi:hypothetical protein